MFKMFFKKNTAFILFFSIIFCLSVVGKVFADDPTPTPTPSPTSAPDNSQAINDLQNQIKDYESKISDLQGQEKTFTSQISIMDNQIKLTELRINATKEQIDQLEKDIDIAKGKVSNLQKDIDQSTKALVGRIAAVYQVGSIKPWQVFLTANDLSDVFTRLTYLRVVQAYDKRKVYAAEQAKNDYANQQDIYAKEQAEAEALNKKLSDYTDQLDQQKADKQTLLSQTQGNEANYQRLLSQAKAQLAGFSKFSQNAGGSSLLSGQTSCDDWGCYYNQRDTQWGGLSLNGTQYSIASDGCLVTSMAMVMTHYGHRSVTPISINSNSDNFASYYPAYLLYTIHADGATAQRIGASIDSTLSSGNPVVVGIRAYGGTHFVVLTSGSGGNYKMRDPYLPNGKDINFTDHYSTGSIFEIDKVVVN
ncbi:MAG TPA: hypothetical protein VG917_02505 [Patescibacteria group bacterium]|nr:hypothetical protein [Patescibacteria group bacterium]